MTLLIRPSAALIATILLIGPAEAAATPDSAAAALTGGNNRFALDLYAELRAQEGNLFFSPFSISTALAMTYAGARGETEAQMAAALHFPRSQSALHPALGALLDSLQAGTGGKGNELRIANRLWGQKGEGFYTEFLDLVQARYGAGLAELDFRGAPEEARQTINAWVEQETRERIRDLIAPGLLNTATRLVLTNAIYWKGAWAKPFEKAGTKKAAFVMASGRSADTVHVQMMYQRGRFPYTETEDFQALELPYAGSDLAMLILLPRSPGGVPALEEALTAETFAAWVKRLYRADAFVFVPRFEIIDSFDLSRTLVSLGMTDAFAPIPGVADFSGMNGRRDLALSAIVHKAHVGVDEEGTEAAAATGVVMPTLVDVYGDLNRPVMIFRAEHPFLFVIRDTRSNSILFIGRVMRARG